MMNHQPQDPDYDELAALYATGALPAGERQAFEKRLEDGCPASRAALRKLDPVVQALADAIPPVPPPADIRASLLKEIQLERPQRPDAAHSTKQEGLLIQRAFEANWEKTVVPGIQRRMLFVDRERKQYTALVRMEPGAFYPSHYHQGPEECLVLEGELQVGAEVLREGDYQHASAGSTHAVQRSENGCLLLIVSPLLD